MVEKNLRLQLELTPEEYLKDRVIYKISLYGRLSKRHRWFYYISSLISIVCAALVPVLISQKFEVYAMILSLIVTIFVSMEKLFHFRQHWRNYDSIESFLRREQIYYQTRTSVYDGKKDEEAFDSFVKRIEEGIKQERDETIEMRTKEIGA
jgi:hypothetical protein